VVCGDWNAGAMAVKKTPAPIALVEKWETMEPEVERHKKKHDIWLNDQLGLRLLIEQSEEVKDSILIEPRWAYRYSFSF
jgi:hypothetical protein